MQAKQFYTILLVLIVKVWSSTNGIEEDKHKDAPSKITSGDQKEIRIKELDTMAVKIYKNDAESKVLLLLEKIRNTEVLKKGLIYKEGDDLIQDKTVEHSYLMSWENFIKKLSEVLNGGPKAIFSCFNEYRNQMSQLRYVSDSYGERYFQKLINKTYEYLTNNTRYLYIIIKNNNMRDIYVNIDSFCMQITIDIDEYIKDALRRDSQEQKDASNANKSETIPKFNFGASKEKIDNNTLITCGTFLQSGVTRNIFGPPKGPTNQQVFAPNANSIFGPQKNISFD
ncbi:hypothetical protein COBT_002905 [Conglomerata obtusa]